MGKVRRGVPAEIAHHPTISPELTLKRLQKLLDQIPEIRSTGHGSTALSTWDKNVKIVLAELYGESSLIFKAFDRIRFGPGVYYQGQPQSDFVGAFNDGLHEAKGFLESRVGDLRENLAQDKQSPSKPASLPDADSRKIFVVHGPSCL